MTEGLPGKVVAIAQSPDGYLWFGTDHGVLRFDGARFALFTPNSADSSYFGASLMLSPQMKSAYVTALLADRENRIWVGTFGGGLSKIENGAVVETYGKRNGLSSASVWSLHEDRRGNIWIGTYDGALCRFGSEQTIITERGPQDSQNAELVSLADNGADGLWVADYRGLMLISGTRTVRQRIRHGSAVVTPVTLFNEDPGRLWIGTEIGAYRLEKGRLSLVWPTKPSPGNVVFSLAKDRAGGLLLGTARGLLRAGDGGFERYGLHDGLSSDQVKAVLTDSAGNIWVGTSGGLDRLTDKPVTSYSTRQGLSSNQVWSVTEDRAGSIWVGTNNGLSRIRDGGIHSYSAKNGIPRGAVGSVLEGPDGAIWFTTAVGICRLRDGQTTVYRVDDGVASDRVFGFGWKADGTLVASANGGLFALIGHRFVAVAPAPRARSILQARDGSLWLCAQQLLRWNGKEFSRYGEVSDEYQTAFEDSQGDIWAGSYMGGLILIRAGLLTRFAHLGAPFSYSVSYITEDRTGHIWIATPNGLFRTSRSELIEYANGVRTDITSNAFGRAEGLPSFGCNAGEQNSGWTDREGRIWVPTGRGIAMLDPARIVTEKAQPHTVIEQVSVDGRNVDPRRSLRLLADYKRIEFRYTGISLEAPEYVRFRYRLDGFDSGWSAAESEHAVSYSTMRPGNYTFRVLSSVDGSWNQSGPIFSFVVVPPFYSTWWFYLACIAMTAALVVAAVRHRIQTIRLRSEIASIERAKIAQEIHDTLLQGVAGASLQLAPLSTAISDRNLRERFDGALNEMQRYMAETRRALWDLSAPDPGDWVIQLERYGRDLTRSTATGFTFQKAGEEPSLPVEVKRDLAQIGQEAILNAVRHSRASELAVALSFDETRLQLSVTDNGLGFEPEKSTGVSGHWGMPGMGQRAKRIGGVLTVISAPGRGTQICLTVEQRRTGEGRHE